MTLAAVALRPSQATVRAAGVAVVAFLVMGLLALVIGVVA